MRKNFLLSSLILIIAMSVYAEETVSPSTDISSSKVYPNEFMESTRHIMDGKHWRLSAVFAPMTFEQERASGGAAKPRWGFQAGGQAHYYFDAVPGLSLSSGLTLAGYFYNLNDGYWDVHSHHVALQIPIRVQYEYKFNDNWAVFGYAGPKFDIGLSFKTDRELGSYGVDTEDFYSSNNNYNQQHRLNFMLGFAGGVRFWDLYLSLGGDFGLNNMYKNDNLTPIHTHQFILTLGYYLPWAW
jgi:hypothetical protein